jgi:DNA helicase HerA-like ATPase
MTTIGTILVASLAEGFVLRLAPHTQELVHVGGFVCIRERTYKHFCLVTDLRLGSTLPAALDTITTITNPIVCDLLKKRFLYTQAQLKPMLTLTAGGDFYQAKSIPPHASCAHIASEQDLAAIFGSEADPSNSYFAIGTPLVGSTPICINLQSLSERSSGVFGKTGTGKTFITRLLLAGCINQKKAVTIIFDMHNEYGHAARSEDGAKTTVPGLKTLFPSRVATFSLDPQSTRKRGSSPDVTITLPLESVRIEDIMLLQQELNLHPTACEAAYLLAAQYKNRWLCELFAAKDRLVELAAKTGAHPESLAALYRKLKAIERLPFFTTDTQNTGSEKTVIDQMINYIDNGISIVIEFGRYTSTICYLLIANIITRRLHSAYHAKVEEYLGNVARVAEPHQLIIVIEEAHKFLNTANARQTIFGIIAREMRKYYISLLVVDQRPSSIDSEILSQIGTKIIAQLSDEKDIAAALTGAPHANDLKNILSTLDSRGQTLIIGHAIPMPIVINTRRYDSKFFATLQKQKNTPAVDAHSDDITKLLYGN